MKIETKFDPEDTVYFMKDNKVTNDKIRSIEVAELNPNNKHRISYILCCNGCYYESGLFKSKKELLNSL